MTAQSSLDTSAARAVGGRSFLGHPVGLGYIVFAEGWERFSFYGMQALLILYMTGHLLNPGVVEGVAGFVAFRQGLETVFGPLSPQALASQIFGLYVGLVYFFPVLGGLVGDRLLGRTQAVLTGASLMALGHFLMAFEQSFLAALACLILGSGLLKGNLAAQVGGLYPKTDSRRDQAFSLYCLAINVGAFAAPLVCGTLGELMGWHYGFAAAGFGMLLGMGIYTAGRRHLPADEARGARETVRLSAADWRTVGAIAALIALTSLYWVGQSQVWNVYPLWLRDEVARGLLGFEVPVTWFQSVDTFAVLLLAPAVIWLWGRQAARAAEPRDLTKIAIGCASFALACALLCLGEAMRGGGAVALVWPLAFHLLCAIGYLYAWPVTLAVVSRSAPAPVNGMMVGAYYLAIFAGGLFSGWLARFYEPMGGLAFWLLHGLVVGAATVAILLFRGGLTRSLGLVSATR